MLTVEEDVNFILHHFFARVNYLVYSLENVSLVNVLSIIYILGMLRKSTAFNFLVQKLTREQNKLLYWFIHAKLRSFNRPKLISRLINILYRFEIRFACFYFRFIHISTLRPNFGPGNCIRTLVEVPQQERWSLVTGTVFIVIENHFL